MFRVISAGLMVLSLMGCATPPASGWWRNLAGLEPVPGNYYFDWRITGDSVVAPLQVFDDGHQTWLQYPVDQPIPAVFERTPQGDRLLRPSRQGEYLVVRGVPARLVIRGGLLQAQVWRPAPESVQLPDTTVIPMQATPPMLPMPQQLTAAPASSPVPLLPPPPPPPPPRLQAQTQTQTQMVHAPHTLQPQKSDRSKPQLSQPQPQSQSQSQSQQPRPKILVQPAISPVFDASPADINVRRALGRWAQAAGWTFEAEHWAVDVDIPLAGSATFEGSFRQAVRELLAATELGDRPVQPCFYSNRVLRVVSLAQRCDRTQAPGEAT